MNIIKIMLSILFLSSILLSSEKRVATLGGNVGFWPDDDSNWLVFPATINNLDMVQVAGLGDNTVPGSAMIVWGEDATFAFKYNQIIDNSENGTDSEYIDWFNLGWGNGKLGATINIGSWSYDSGVPNSTGSSASFYGVGLGRNMKFGELGTFFEMLAVDDGDVNTEDKGSWMFGANIRREQKIWLFDDMLIGFNWASTTGEDGEVDTKDSNTWMDVDIDLYTHINPSENIDVLFALGFGYWTYSEDDGDPLTIADTKQSIITLPQSTIAIEALLRDWAICRFGVNHSYMMGTNGDESWSGSYNHLNTLTTYTGTDPASTFSWNFGIGLDFNSFSVDMSIKDDFFSNPMPYLTGYNDKDIAEGSVTLTYKF